MYSLIVITFTLENMEKADAPIYVWETRGPDEGQAYDANYFKNIGIYKPNENKFSIEVKPYSIVTITTLDKTADTSVYNCKYEDIPLDINYSDDFEYTDDFLSARGYAPLYTTDYGGAFEVAEVNGNKVLMQMINADNKPTDWRFRGTPYPITSLGDDRWSNYNAEIDFKLVDNSDRNYISFGVRYLLAELDTNTAENGYSLKITPDGKWSLRKNTKSVAEGVIENFDNSVWHTIKITANGKNITVYLDENELTSYLDESSYAHSGRIMIGSSLYNNLFDNLKVTPIDGVPHTITRVDDHDASITYTGDWYRTVPDGYVHFNRTISRAESEGAEMSFTFAGNHFALIGQSDAATIEVYVDGELFETAETAKTQARQCSYSADIENGKHDVKIRVVSGKFTVDAIEY